VTADTDDLELNDIKAVTYSYDDLLGVTLGHVEFCLGKAENCEDKAGVLSWHQRAMGAFDVWQMLVPARQPAKDRADFCALLEEFKRLPETDENV
jgi:hypothetical protein